MSRGGFVIEFRSGSFFTSPKAERGGTLEQAMRFSSIVEAHKYADYNVPWVWQNGGCVCSYDERRASAASYDALLQGDS